MNRLTFLTFLTFLVFGLWACSEQSRDSSNDPAFQPDIETENDSSSNPTIQTDIKTENSKYRTINLQFNHPTVLGGSDWVLYPLRLEELKETSKGFQSSSYGYRESVYWNVAFYNTETKQTRLLSENLKMIIYSISPRGNYNPITQSGQRNNINDDLIYYTVRTTDFNQDGKLNSDDPRYLFISDLSGQNFRQISPDNFDLVHWEVILGTNKILIQACNDSNKDKKFNSNDEIVSFVYDIESQKIQQIFDQEFILKTKKLLENQWAKGK